MDKLSGAELAKQVDEYSEVYGQVLLGIHREVTTYRTRFEKLRRETRKALSKSAQLIAYFDRNGGAESVLEAVEAFEIVRQLRELESLQMAIVESLERIAVSGESVGLNIRHAADELGSKLEDIDLKNRIQSLRDIVDGLDGQICALGEQVVHLGQILNQVEDLDQDIEELITSLRGNLDSIKILTSRVERVDGSLRVMKDLLSSGVKSIDNIGGQLQDVKKGMVVAFERRTSKQMACFDELKGTVTEQYERQARSIKRLIVWSSLQTLFMMIVLAVLGYIVFWV